MAESQDLDPQETFEWLEALDAVFEREGVERAHYLVGRLVRRARRKGAHLPYRATTAYINTISETIQKKSPGDSALEWRIRSFIRWNAMAMVVQANRVDPSLGGHISSFASAATLYEVGFNHFFHAPQRITVETCSTSRGTSPPVSMRAPSWKVGSARTSSTTSARRSIRVVSPPTPIRD